MVRQHRQRLRDDAGIGLTELAVAIVVLGIVLVGLFPLIVGTIGLSQGTAEVGQANRIVLTNINQSRAQSLTASCPFSGTSSMPLFENPEPETYAGQIDLTCASGDRPGVTVVTVSVWRVEDEDQRAISSATTKVRA